MSDIPPQYRDMIVFGTGLAAKTVVQVIAGDIEESFYTPVESKNRYVKGIKEKK